MTNKRTDTASLVIIASPQSIYQAFLAPEAIAAWRPPAGMTCKIYDFNPQQGGTFRMSFGYEDNTVPGKTSAHEDVFHGQFLELIPGKRIVELVEFESDNPAFAGKMTITTSLEPVEGGTAVTFICENVPVGILPGDHYEGMMSSLQNLATFLTLAQ